MRSLVAVLIVSSLLAVLVALFETSGPQDDELARAITTLVERSR